MAIYPYSFTLPPVNKQDIPSNGVPGEFLGISAGGVLDWLPVAGGSGTGDLLAANNLSELTPTAGTARTNLGLGTGDSPTFANLTLTSPSLSSSAPVTISQTWGTTGIYTAFKVVATETLSANTASNLLELWSGSTPALKLGIGKGGSIISKVGVITPSGTANASGLSLELFFSGCGLGIDNNGSTQFIVNGIAKTRCGLGVVVASDQVIAWSSTTHTGLGVASDTILVRDSASGNTLALRNGALAQTFRVYKSYLNAGVDYERLSFSHDGVQFGIGTERAGSGIAQPLRFFGGSSAALDFANGVSFRNASGGTTFMTVASSGNVGIGTTAPSEKLHVLGGKVLFGDATDVTGTAGNGDLTLRAYRSPQIHISANTSSSVLYGLNIELNNNIYAGLLLNLNSGEVKIGGLSVGGYFPTFYADNVERMRISAAGNVGIGTTAPGAKLQVGTHSGAVPSGSVVAIAGAVPRLSFSSNDDSLNYGGYILSNYAAGTFMTLGTRDSNVDTAALTLKGGNVGIGTTAPGSALHISGQMGGNVTTYDSASSLKLTNTSGGVVSWLLSAGVIGIANNFFAIRQESTAMPALTIANATNNIGIGTTSPTSKLHVVGDAVLTGDLLGTNYTIGVPTILTQSNISITNNHSGVADSAIVITPKGTGAFILGPKPDGTATGGNARGAGSTDLQKLRTVNDQVASGGYSTITGGYQNKATNSYAFVGGGVSNSATGSASVVSGGSSCTASGAQSAAAGLRNVAASDYSFIAGGSDALANRVGLSAHASGLFVVTGDAQKTTAVFRNKTTTNTAVELFLDGSSARYTITSGKIISMLINITGTKSDGSAVAHYVRQYSIKNIGGTTSEVYAAVTVGTDNAAGTSIALSADNTNDSLKIEVTGVASETWRWVASVDAVEVGHGV